MKNYLLCVDLEGVHGIVGEPFKSLNETSDYALSIENATKEINVVVKALFEEGADNVYVWDNHGSGINLDFSKIDCRAKKAVFNHTKLTRMDMVKAFDITYTIFIGYHAREGTADGVLAHTYNSSANQYFKFNGVQYGEYEIDNILAARYKVPALLTVSDEAGIAQMKRFTPDVVAIATKKGINRNTAILYREEQVLDELYKGTKKALKEKHVATNFAFPCEIEVRYTRMEWAEKRFDEIRNAGIRVAYKEDCHTLTATLYNAEEIRYFF